MHAGARGWWQLASLLLECEVALLKRLCFTPPAPPSPTCTTTMLQLVLVRCVDDSSVRESLQIVFLSPLPLSAHDRTCSVDARRCCINLRPEPPAQQDRSVNIGQRPHPIPYSSAAQHHQHPRSSLAVNRKTIGLISFQVQSAVVYIRESMLAVTL